MTAFIAKKSFKEGHVAVHIDLKSRGWHTASVNVKGSADLSCSEARELASALLAEADRADAKVAAKKAAEERRKKWRDRQVLAGKMRVISL